MPTRWIPLCAFSLLLVGAGCGSWQDDCQKLDPPAASLLSQLTHGEGTSLFEDATSDYGIHHIADSSQRERHYDGLVGGGVALADFDANGHLDIIVTGGDAPNRHFFNQGDASFLECGRGTGVAREGDWSLGVSVADFDNDGDPDVFLLNHGKNRVLRNNGDGSFEDITTESGIEGDARSGGASWADLDGDGLLDVLIVNLLEDFVFEGGVRAFFYAERPQLYRNLGGGRFLDVSARVGSSGLPEGSSYIGVMHDLNGDYRPDILLTQEFGEEVLRNQLYQNLGPEPGESWVELENVTEGAGIADPRAAMGAALFDFNVDGLPEIYITNLQVDGGEVMLWNAGNLTFDNVVDIYGVDGTAVDFDNAFYRTVSWGALALDVDNDGDDDLYTAYGEMPIGDSPKRCEPMGFSGVCTPQPNVLFQNDANTSFTMLEGTGSEDHGSSRGVGAGDFNLDGCVDLFVVNQNAPSRLLLNRCSEVGGSVMVKLEGTVSNRDAVGAMVTLESDGLLQNKFVTAGSTSVHSAQPFELHFGVGDATVVTRLTVTWPTGLRESFENLPINSVMPTRVSIREGEGIVN